MARGTMAMGRRELLMWNYNKTLEYPVNIKCPNPRLARYIISQYGGPDRRAWSITKILKSEISECQIKKQRLH